MSKEDKETFDNMKDGGAIEYKEISGQTVDADDLIVPKLTVRYLNKNASTAENISNIPAKGGFVLESMCVRYVDEDNCGYIQTYYSQNSDSRILPFLSQDNIQTGSGLSGGVPWEDTCASMKPTKKWELLFRHRVPGGEHIRPLHSERRGFGHFNSRRCPSPDRS